MTTSFTDYLPNPADLNPDDVITARQRLQTFINQFWPELDTRPNSVFGDIHLTPLATLVAAIELAKNKLFSDLDLSNVARGIIYNPDFVAAYLKGLGVASINAVAATGVIKLTFSEDIDYSFDLDAPFTFGNQVFKIDPLEGNPVVVSGTNSQSGRRVLIQVAADQYVVFLPVKGPPGSVVNDGDSATFNLTISQLTGVSAAGDFDSGLMPDSLAQLAIKAQRNFASANLTSRSGVISFIHLRFPNSLGVSATLTGDAEMIRPGKTPLGLTEGAIDVFVKSKADFISSQSLVTLVYDSNLQAWVGQVLLPVIPAFMDLKAGIFQVGNFQNSRGVNKIFSKSVHPYVDNIGVAYSRYEKLGIMISDTTPDNFDASVLSGVTATVSDGTALQVQGEYMSDVFNAKPERNLTLRVDSVVTLNSQQVLQVNVRDNLSGEVGTLFFQPNVISSPNSAILMLQEGDYRRMVNGLNMKLIPPGGSLVMPDLIGFAYQFSFRGRSSSFTINYLYDPIVNAADAVVQNPDNKPVNVSVFTRSFLVCYISDFVINYRIPYGAQVNQEAIRQAVSNYVNSILYPDVYEESQISTIMSIFGGGSLMSISKRGVFYPSIGGVYVDRNGNQTPVPRIDTSTLMPPVNSAGIGARNVTYLLDPTNITFNATIR